MGIHGKSILIDGDTWKIDSHRWGFMGVQPGHGSKKLTSSKTSGESIL